MITNEKDLIKEVLKELSKTRFSPQVTIKDVFDYIEKEYKEGVLFQKVDKKVAASVLLKMFQDYFFVHIVKDSSPQVELNGGVIMITDKDLKKSEQKLKIQVSIGQNPGEESFKTAVEILSEIFEDKKVFSFIKNFFEKNVEKHENENGITEYIIKDESLLEKFEKALKTVKVRYEKREKDFLKDLEKMLGIPLDAEKEFNGESFVKELENEKDFKTIVKKINEALRSDYGYLLSEHIEKIRGAVVSAPLNREISEDIYKESVNVLAFLIQDEAVGLKEKTEGIQYDEFKKLPEFKRLNSMIKNGNVEWGVKTLETLKKHYVNDVTSADSVGLGELLNYVNPLKGDCGVVLNEKAKDKILTDILKKLSGEITYEDVRIEDSEYAEELAEDYGNKNAEVYFIQVEGDDQGYFSDVIDTITYFTKGKIKPKYDTPLECYYVADKKDMNKILKIADAVNGGNLGSLGIKKNKSPSNGLSV